MANLIDLVPGEQEDVWGQIVEDNIKAVNTEVEGALHRLGSLAEQVTGVKTFIDKPVVPVRSWPMDRLDASGRDPAALGTKYLRDDGVWASPPGGATGGSANTPGTLNNPITSATAARPTGLTRVIWDTATDPVNWVDGDLNMQKGT